MDVRFINDFSWKSFLSSQTKNIESYGKFRTWQVQKRQQLVSISSIENSDLDYLKSIKKTNFFYWLPEDIKIIQESNFFKIKKTKDPNIIIDLSKLIYSGNKYKDIRNYINKFKKLNFTVERELRSIEHFNKMIKIWSDKSGEKYFQDRSGKNTFFFKNNFHLNGINTFIYNGDDLVAFSILSPKDDKNHSSYVIGKSLCIDYHGLSEFADIESFNLAKSLGVDYVSFGGGSANLIKYKTKFPGVIRQDTYDGQLILKESI